MKQKKRSKNPKFKDVVINNLTAKHCSKFNRGKVEVCKKTSMKKGKGKYKSTSIEDFGE